MWNRWTSGLALAIALACACGGGDSSLNPAGSSSSGPANLAGTWTYRHQAPTTCPLPSQHRTLTFRATITAQGGNVYYMSLAGTDAASFSFFYWAGSRYNGNILFSRTTASDYAVFSVNEAPFSVSGDTISGNVSGQYQYVGSSLVDCRGTFAITITR